MRLNFIIITLSLYYIISSYYHYVTLYHYIIIILSLYYIISLCYHYIILYYFIIGLLIDLWLFARLFCREKRKYGGATTWGWQLIADHNEWPNRVPTIRRFLFELVGMMSLNRIYWEVNLLFVLPILFYLNILKTEKILQFWSKEVNHLRRQLTADHNEWPNRLPTIRRFLFELAGMISLDRNYWEVNLLFLLPIFFFFT